MKRQPKSVTVTRQPGQISAPGGENNYLVRQAPLWSNPSWLTADVWRAFVRRQPIAVLCREAITNYLLSLDWTITARDSEKQDELKDEIKYYTRLLERGHSDYTTIDFATHTEWIVKDLFDLPFGAAGEIGREYNAPSGKVAWIKPIDGGTLAPTLDVDYPVVQQVAGFPTPVFFGRDFISRVYLSPRTEIQREGWGMAPPERIYLAMEMLNRGDIYYSQLLLNTPEAGILDLGDMDQESATSWVASFRDLLYGINPLKIPVLYEHTTEAKWIPFGKLPSEILYDSVTSRYITVLTAGYGLTPSDIGMGGTSNGGETMSGTIRNERVSNRSGKSLAKKKTKAYWENILPEYLKFQWIDFDDEKNVAASRARMANANADGLFITNQIFSPDELRRQHIADGTISITIPETLDRRSIEWPTNALRYIGNKPSGDGKTGTNQIGDPKAPSSGGLGEVKPQQIISRSRAKIEVSLSKAIFSGNQILGSLINSVRTSMNDFTEWEKMFSLSVVGKSFMDLISETVIDDTYNNISDNLIGEPWLDTVSVELANVCIDNYNQRHFADAPEFVEIITSTPLTLESVMEQVSLAIKAQRESDETIKILARERQVEIDREVEKRVSIILANQGPKISDSLNILAGSIEKSIQRDPQPSVINVSMPKIDVTANLPKGDAPSVTFSPTINPSEVVVQNSTPVENVIHMDAPVTHVSVEPTPVQITNQNDITVQPADVTVVQTRPHTAEVKRDSEGKIVTISTKE